MKTLFFATAVVLMTAFGSSANAEMLTLTSSNNGSFTFDAMNSTDNLVTTNGDDGLSDVAFFLGYETGSAATGTTTETLSLNSGMGVTTAANTGQFTFDTVTFSNGVSVDAVANFRLVDATGQGLGHHVVYDLALTTSGVSTATEGSLQSFVGFDFDGDATDAIQANQTISGFGTSDIAVGSASRVLVGDFTYPVGQGGGLTTVAASNTNIDLFNGTTGSNLGDRFDGSFNAFSTGDLAFGAFNDFLSRDVNQTDTTAGVFGFRSSATATIPEPSTLMMASIGLGMVAFRRRKRA